jgi:chaperonin GroES
MDAVFVNESGIHPVNDLVLVQPIDIEERSAGGIVLPTSLVEKQEMAEMHGTLITKGEKAETHPATKDIDVGQMILFAKFSGVKYRGNDGVWYRVMRAEDVLAKVDKASDQNSFGRVTQAEVLDNQPVTV